MPWVYVGEIFPNRLREGGIAVSTATQWLFNFVFSQITPHAVDNLGWRTFLMFAIFNWSLVFYVWFFIKEVRSASVALCQCAADNPTRQKEWRSSRWKLVSPVEVWPLWSSGLTIHLFSLRQRLLRAPRQ